MRHINKYFVFEKIQCSCFQSCKNHMNVTTLNSALKMISINFDLVNG